jgi:hypothetical protein
MGMSGRTEENNKRQAFPRKAMTNCLESRCQLKNLEPRLFPSAIALACILCVHMHTRACLRNQDIHTH